MTDVYLCADDYGEGYENVRVLQTRPKFGIYIKTDKREAERYADYADEIDTLTAKIDVLFDSDRAVVR